MSSVCVQLYHARSPRGGAAGYDATVQRLDARIIGADVVEYNPRRDVAAITAAAGAKLMKELAARMLEAVRA